MMKHRKNQGFTLIELMIVVAIIAVIASIAIPGILTARRAANENSALGTVRSFVTAAANFAANRDDQRYFTGTSEFTDFFSHIDTKGGYEFEYEVSDDASKFTYVATPVSTSNGGVAFYGDERNQLFRSEVPLSTDIAAINSANADFSLANNRYTAATWEQKN